MITAGQAKDIRDAFVMEEVLEITEGIKTAASSGQTFINWSIANEIVESAQTVLEGLGYDVSIGTTNENGDFTNLFIDWSQA